MVLSREAWERGRGEGERGGGEEGGLGGRIRGWKLPRLPGRW